MTTFSVMRGMILESSNSRAKFACGPDLFKSAYYGEVDIDGERIRQLPKDDVPEELLEEVRQCTDSGVVYQESEGYLPEKEDVEDQSGLIAYTDRRNMIVSDKNIKLIRFTSDIFEQRKRPIPKHAVCLSDIKNPEGGQKSKVEPLSVSYTNTHKSIDSSSVMDAETENWPIPMKHRHEFEVVKFNYEASSLRLYRGNSLVEPGDVNDALTGAIIQVSS
ncbi:hypothetical protein K503DRAFT_803276 [Rhizopogon vinicolor AM-OR11-026]|uniref:Uncharacterized protein n=1 Tax=Rhizopogon vinicolor AM-OR11-026 TaxID=1314800 RepID=A0A1B7MQE8_9AGAM|nr:hypothetical protein K503DRAFT_803276 [Rhizopogon vinicolor AM-OR11-026]